MIDPTLAVLLTNLILLLVSLINALRVFFKPSLVVYLVTMYACLSVLPIVITPVPPSLATSIGYTCITFFVANTLWDSRHFIIDTFKFKNLLLSRPHYVAVPVTIILAATNTFPATGIHISAPLALLQVSIAVVFSEIIYSASKRNEWLIRTRRESLPRVVSNVVTPTFNQTRIQFR